MTIVIRKLRLDDKERWLELWDLYLEFYQKELPAPQTELSWERLLSSSDGLRALVAELEGKIVGIAHYFWTSSTWSENQDLYLEDLFVSPEARNSGVAKALIGELKEICLQAGGSKVHWQTHKDNLAARRLYDSLAELSEFVVYEIRS